jgi:hypothetical protein
MDERIMATGVEEAVLIDTLLRLGVDVDDLLSMPRVAKLRLLAQAVNDGMLDPDYVARLRTFGLLPDPD